VQCYKKAQVQKIFLSSLISTVLFLSCKDWSRNYKVPDKDNLNKGSIDTSLTNSSSYKLEQKTLAEIRKLTKELSLYDLKNETIDYELRAWKMRTYEPSILYVLKCSDSIWTLRHYQYYHRSENFDDSPPIIDSVIMETVKPQKMAWSNYIKQLNLDSIWNLKTESAIKGKSFEVLDGWIWLLEISNKKDYKYFYYTVPEFFKDKDINHKNFTDFIKRLIEPIIYNGMINP
jgi:hypothetical protein